MSDHAGLYFAKMSANLMSMNSVLKYLVVCLCAGPFAANAAEPMNGAEILAAFPGMTMVGNYADGLKFTETYLSSGAIDYRDDMSVTTGHWFERNGLFCTFYIAANGACYTVKKSGANCYEYFIREEEDGTLSPMANKWNSVGWDETKPSTCDLSDKVS
jgi:hypothetical protein